MCPYLLHLHSGLSYVMIALHADCRDGEHLLYGLIWLSSKKHSLTLHIICTSLLAFPCTVPAWHSFATEMVVRGATVYDLKLDPDSCFGCPSCSKTSSMSIHSRIWRLCLGVLAPCLPQGAFCKPVERFEGADEYDAGKMCMAYV